MRLWGAGISASLILLAACAAATARRAGRNPLLLRVHDVEETLRFLAVLARSAPTGRPAPDRNDPSAPIS